MMDGVPQDCLSGPRRRCDWPRLWWGLITTIVGACGFSTASGSNARRQRLGDRLLLVYVWV
jgi:hypothetical protein